MEILYRLQQVTHLLLLARPQSQFWLGPSATSLEHQIENQIREVESLRDQLWLN
jgi:hypothetical protein